MQGTDAAPGRRVARWLTEHVRVQPNGDSETLCAFGYALHAQRHAGERGTEMSKAKVEVWFKIDEKAYAEYYGETPNGETVGEALEELNMWLRRYLQGEERVMRFAWATAVVGRPHPVPDDEGEATGEEHSSDA